MPLRSIPAVEVGRNLHWKLYSGLIVDLLDQTSGIENQVMFESREPAMKHFSVPFFLLLSLTDYGYFVKHSCRNG